MVQVHCHCISGIRSRAQDLNKSKSKSCLLSVLEKVVISRAVGVMALTNWINIYVLNRQNLQRNSRFRNKGYLFNVLNYSESNIISASQREDENRTE